MATSPPLTDPAFLGHVAVFAVAALACLASAARARQVEDPDTRRGLVALLLTSGGWAAAHVGFLLAPTVATKTALYVAGLIVGFAAVGTWLYFCSAFTGRSLHRDPTLRRLAVAVFLGAILVKVTNPLHGLYFTTELATAPFPHLAVQHGQFHWVLMGLSYALAFVGYFMLLDLFVQVGADARPLAALVAVTGLPVVLDLLGTATPYLIDVTYEPVGVAVFAVVVLFVYLDRFQAIQLAGSSDAPTVVLADDGRVRDYNRGAADLFSALHDRDAIGEPVEDVLPDVLETDEGILEVETGGETRYYQASTSTFAAGGTGLGRLLSFADVTDRERYRRDLERQNERLEQFTGVVSHDLRNPLNVAMAHVEMARERHGDDGLETAANALDRMQALVEDLLGLARTGQPIDEMEPVALSAIAEECFGLVEAPEANLEVDGDARFLADPDRLRQLLENLLRNAVDHGRPDVTIRAGPIEAEGELTGFYVEDDGPGIPEGDREDVFESGYTTDDDGTGFGLSIVSEVVEAHGWSIAATASESGGARFEVRGVEPAE